MSTFHVFNIEGLGGSDIKLQAKNPFNSSELFHELSDIVWWHLNYLII